MNCAVKNSNNKKNGSTYDEPIKHFASYLFMLGGRMLYETLYANLPLPSLSSISRYINLSPCIIAEGNCRSSELKQYLLSKNLPLIVWLSEDAARITSKIQYDAKSNQVVGFVLPLDENGMPVKNTYKATSLKNMVNFFENGKKASLAYAIMAQPLEENASSFCLCIYSTDNKLSYEHIIRRWKYLINCLKDLGITVLGISSDGDPRLLKAMRIEATLGCKINNSNIMNYNSQINTDVVFLQDTVHIGTKLRNRLLKPSIILSMGDHIVSQSHLKILLNLVSKYKHCLCEKDISVKDKMNFASVEKISHPCVSQLLEKHVPTSAATVSYLKIIHLFLKAFLCKDLTPSERIHNAWFCIMFLRYWRSWIDKIAQYSVTENFITLNAYLCMELNGHGLVALINRFQSNSNLTSEEFLSWLCSSQTCESFFRALRSMGSTYSTIVNFSILEVLHKIMRIQLQSEITNINNEHDDTNFRFPRTENKLSVQRNTIKSFPSISHINDIVQKAKEEAFSEITSLGMIVERSDANDINAKCVGNIDLVEINPDLEESTCDTLDSIVESQIHKTCSEIETSDLEPNLLEDMSTLCNVHNILDLKKYDNHEELKSESSFICIKDSANNNLIVR